MPLGSWNTASSWKISSIAVRRRRGSISPNTSWRLRSNKVDTMWDMVLALEERVPILCLRPRLEVVEGDVGKLTAERCAIDRVADTVEPLVHLGAALTHALMDDVQRDLEIGELATGDT